MQENQPKDNIGTAELNSSKINIGIGPVHPEDKKVIERVLNNEPAIPPRNDRPIDYELKVHCEDGFDFVLQKRALNKIVKEGALEDRIRNYRNAIAKQERLSRKEFELANPLGSREQV